MFISQTRVSSSQPGRRSESRSAGGRSPKPEKDRGRSWSTYNSHKNSRYRHDRVRSSRESSCKSEWSQTVRSSQSPWRKLRDDEYGNTKARRSRSPGRRKDDDGGSPEEYCKRRARRSGSPRKTHKDKEYGKRRERRDNSLSTVDDGGSSDEYSKKSTRRSRSPRRTHKDKEYGKRRDRRDDSLSKVDDGGSSEECGKRNIRRSRSAERRRKDSLSKMDDDDGSPASDKQRSYNRNRRNRDDDSQSMDPSKSHNEEGRSYTEEEGRKESDGYRGSLDSTSQRVENDVRDCSHKKKRSTSKDPEERYSKRRAVERGGHLREDRESPELPHPEDVLVRLNRKAPHQEDKQLQEASGRTDDQLQQKRRTPSDEGEIFSRSSSSPKNTDESSQDTKKRSTSKDPEKQHCKHRAVERGGHHREDRESPERPHPEDVLVRLNRKPPHQDKQVQEVSGRTDDGLRQKVRTPSDEGEIFSSSSSSPKNTHESFQDTKKRSTSKDPEKQHCKRRAVERGGHLREDRESPELPHPKDVVVRLNRKAPHQEDKQLQEVSGRTYDELRQKRRTPSDEGEVFSSSSRSPKNTDESSQDTKKRSISKDPEERHHKRRAVERGGHLREDKASPELPHPEDVLVRLNRKMSHQEDKQLQEVSGRTDDKLRQKRRAPSEEGEICSSSSSSPNNTDESSQDSITSHRAKY